MAPNLLRTSRMPKVAVWVDVAAALLAVTVIGLGDAWTDTRISLAVFHVVPIAVVAARHGLWPSVPVLIAATAASGMVDVMAGVHIADGAFILFWRTFDRLLVYVGAIVLLARLRHLYRQAEALARLDGLTGLLNQRAFKERCAEELRRCARHGQQLSVAVLDLDGFKAVNDTFGHAAGDDVLREVGGVLRASKWRSVGPARRRRVWGGVSRLRRRGREAGGRAAAPGPGKGPVSSSVGGSLQHRRRLER